MKLYLYTLALTVTLAFIADIQITWRPFSITMARPWLAAGVILFMCGIICLKAQWYEDGLKKGAGIKEETSKQIKESI